MKEFKAKKIKKRKSNLIIFIFILFFFFSYVYMFLYLKKHNSKKDLLDKSTNYINFNILSYIDNKITNYVNKPVNFLEFKSDITYENKANNNIKKVSSSLEEKEYKPLIYLYNTHQTEKYSNYSVYDATMLLSSKLSDDNYYTYFEENSIPTFLNNNKMKYYDSYKASRYYLNSTYNNYSSLKYFFDIHRDSISRDKVTLNYNNKNYAKILFLIGLKNKNYEDNLKENEKLNSIINNKVPSLSKGIYKKGGKNVNGVYNQDLGKYVFLVEIGSLYSSKDEVVNTIDVLKESIKDYINLNDQL